MEHDDTADEPEDLASADPGGTDEPDPGGPDEPEQDEPERDEPGEADELPLAQLGGPRDEQPPVRPVRVWWFVGAAAAVVIVGLVVGILVFNHSTANPRHGAATANAAATQFVDAVNAGSEQRAAAISCDIFMDDAKAIAHSGQDPAFRVRLQRVEPVAAGTATAVVVQQADVAGQRQTQTTRISITRRDGLWLMCGQAG